MEPKAGPESGLLFSFSRIAAFTLSMPSGLVATQEIQKLGR